MELHNILLNKVVNFKCNLETLELCKKNQKFVWAELCFESTHFPHVIKNQYLYCLGAAFYAFLVKKINQYFYLKNQFQNQYKREILSEINQFPDFKIRRARIMPLTDRFSL